jgi:hypothetical protein
MKTSVLKKCVLVLLVISSGASCIESINLKLGANLNYFFSPVFSTLFKKLIFLRRLKSSFVKGYLKS